MRKDCMDINEITEYFNRAAEKWDDEMIKDDTVIQKILDCANVKSGAVVLDAACGTGVLVPYLLHRNVGKIYEVDISQKMLEICQRKYSCGPIEFVNTDASEYHTAQRFDCIIIYNALPHFLCAEKVIENLSRLLVPGGVLTVAHGMSRKKIESFHHGSASEVSRPLMPADDLSRIFSRFLKVKTVTDNDKMYIVTGVYE